MAAWLADWQPAASHLLLLGPSAGYSLDQAFLSRFRRVTVVEPDPIARRILAWRFRGIQLDHQAPGARLLDPLRHHPDAAVLFCNLLGQDWRGAGDDAARINELDGLRQALNSRGWASYHDVVSTTVQPRAMGPIEVNAGALEDLLGHFWAGGELPLVDHHTHVLGAGRAGRYVVWRLTPGQYHLVGWTSSDV